MIKRLIFAALMCSSAQAYSAGYPDIKLTSEQCEDWIYSEYISLTKENKEIVRQSCAERYSSENAMGNCTAFEGEDLIKHLKKLAKVQCKKENN